MIIAIDETGSFNADSKWRNFFIAVHLRQRKTLYKEKRDQFSAWEATIARSLKNPRGEIKTSLLSDGQLSEFARRVMVSPHYVGITPVAIRPADNAREVVEKHRLVKLRGIREGTKWYAGNGREGLARTYNEFGNWFEKLNYQQSLKILVLGTCIADSFTNTVGHAISGGYDDELVRIKFKIDRDFVREPRTMIFWRETLRNELYSRSVKSPIPVLEEWKKKGHPFLEKYHRNGQFDFNELFQRNCDFVRSHEHFEIRIADGVNTIFSRFLNEGRCAAAYNLVRRCILHDGYVHQLVLNDFDLSKWRFDETKNPFLQSPSVPTPRRPRATRRPYSTPLVVMKV